MSVLLNAVVDSLDVRVFRHAAPSVRLWRDVSVWRELIANSEPGDPAQYVQLPGLGTFRIKMGGRAPYEFVLMNPQIADIRIWNPNRWSSKAASQTGQFYVSFRSTFLQHRGIEAARTYLQLVTDLFCIPGDVHPDSGPEFDRISRIDPAADTQEEREMLWADLDRFVCRARKLDTWAHLTPANVEELLKVQLTAGSYLPQEALEGDGPLPQCAKAASKVLRDYVAAVVGDLETYGEADLSRIVSHGRKPQTIYFGRFGSQLYARRYNKLGSLVVQNKLHMLDVFRDGGWDEESPVLRTEFSISGDFLKDYRHPGVEDCRDLATLETWLPTLWEYLVTDWLRMTDPSGTDSNHRRWDTAASWALLEAAFGPTDCVGARDHARHVPREDKHLILQVHGCTVSTVALRAAALGSVDEAMDSVASDIFLLWDDTFKAAVNERLEDFGLDQFTDTALSAAFRRERLIELAGS